MKKFTFALTAVAAIFAAESAPDAKTWWAHIEYLAGDALEGRLAGSPGHKKAAEYVASKFDQYGLKPAGGKGSYLQPVPFEVRVLNEPASSFDLITNGKARAVKLGEEANLSVRIDKPAAVDAEAVFVGHALRIPEANIDDLAGIDLKGKIAVYLSGAPKRVPGPLAAHSQTTAERWKTLRAAGAIGTLSLADPATTDIPWSRSTLRRLDPSVRLTEPALIDNVGTQIAAAMNPEHADLFFEGTGHTSKELLELHRADKPLPKFPLKFRIRAKTAFSAKAITSDNVAALLPGATKETVVITAHLDHLGVGGEVNGDKIYNGAMDNASGVAAVLEMARSLAGKKPKRNILFAAVTGEEHGLLGSKYFAAHLPVPAQDVVADVNLDMFLPILPLKALTVYGLDESDLGDEFAALAEKFGVKAERDPQPARNIFIRSDQYSFIRRGVPALSFKVHAYPGTPEMKVMEDWLHNRYHAPSDDLKQPVNMETAAKFNKLLGTFIEEVANRPTRPSWKPQSFFKRYASSSD